MDRDVRRILEQGLFKLFDEQPFAADFRQWRIENAIAGGLDDEQFDTQVSIERTQTIADMMRLPQGKSAATGGDPNE
jgi:hypothetical protein